MAIQVRRGNEVDFDPSKMLPGEWAVSLDTKYVRMCFSPGVCLRMATYEAFEADMEQIKALLAEAESIEEAVANIQTEINDIAVVVEDYAIISKSYAVGGTGKRENEDSDNAKYYYEQTKQISQGINGIVPMGTVTFANLPTSDIVKNAMYNVSDAFVSDERFNDGGGVSYGPGNNVIWTAEGFWDVTASSSVTGVKGENETTYRQGNVNITKESIGVGDYGTENISDIADGTVKGAIRELADNPADSARWISKAEFNALSEEEQNTGTYDIYDMDVYGNAYTMPFTSDLYTAKNTGDALVEVKVEVSENMPIFEITNTDSHQGITAVKIGRLGIVSGRTTLSTNSSGVKEINIELPFVFKNASLTDNAYGSHYRNENGNAATANIIFSELLLGSDTTQIIGRVDFSEQTSYQMYGYTVIGEIVT